MGLALTLPRLPRRADPVGLAAASAAVLIALQVSDGYFSFSYMLWFVPLVLVALSCDSGTPAPALEHGRELDTDTFPYLLHRGTALRDRLAGA